MWTINICEYNRSHSSLQFEVSQCCIEFQQLLFHLPKCHVFLSFCLMTVRISNGKAAMQRIYYFFPIGTFKTVEIIHLHSTQQMKNTRIIIRVYSLCLSQQPKLLKLNQENRSHFQYNMSSEPNLVILDKLPN